MANLTQQNFEEIEAYLARRAKKDSQLPLASILDGEEKIPLVQDNMNKLATLAQFGALVASMLTGEDKVTWRQVCTAGNHIADIKIGDTTTQVFTPRNEISSTMVYTKDLWAYFSAADDTEAFNVWKTFRGVATDVPIGCSELPDGVTVPKGKALYMTHSVKTIDVTKNESTYNPFSTGYYWTLPVRLGGSTTIVTPSEPIDVDLTEVWESIEDQQTAIQEAQSALTTLKQQVEDNADGVSVQIQNSWEDFKKELTPEDVFRKQSGAAATWDANGNLRTIAGTLLTTNENQAITTLRSEFNTISNSMLNLSADELQAIATIAAALKDNDGELISESVILSVADAKGAASEVESRYFELIDPDDPSKGRRLKSTAGLFTYADALRAAAEIASRYFDGNGKLKSSSALFLWNDVTQAIASLESKYFTDSKLKSSAGTNILSEAKRAVASLLSQYYTYDEAAGTMTSKTEAAVVTLSEEEQAVLSLYSRYLNNTGDINAAGISMIANAVGSKLQLSASQIDFDTPIANFNGSGSFKGSVEATSGSFTGDVTATQFTVLNDTNGKPALTLVTWNEAYKNAYTNVNIAVGTPVFIAKTYNADGSVAKQFVCNLTELVLGSSITIGSQKIYYNLMNSTAAAIPNYGVQSNQQVISLWSDGLYRLGVSSADSALADGSYFEAGITSVPVRVYSFLNKDVYVMVNGWCLEEHKFNAGVKSGNGPNSITYYYVLPILQVVTDRTGGMGRAANPDDEVATYSVTAIANSYTFYNVIHRVESPCLVIPSLGVDTPIREMQESTGLSYALDISQNTGYLGTEGMLQVKDVYANTIKITRNLGGQER